jgi:hypothetical protein
MTFLPIALYWGVALTGLFSRKPILLWLFFVSLPFGSMVVIPTNLTGGLSLVPQSMTAMLIVVHEMLLRRSGPGAFATLALRMPGLALFLFWIVSVIITLFAPRLFAGQIEVVPMSAPELSFMQTALLFPTKQNVSQLAYITVSVFSVFAFARTFHDYVRLQILMRGVMVTGVIVIVTGFLDLAATYVPISPLLELFRTAEYAILDSATIVGGVKRVIGIMPEASSYGGLALTVLSLLWFLRRAMLETAMKRRANGIMVGLALMVVLSTSSASYVGMAVLLTIGGLEWGVLAASGERSAISRRDIRGDFVLALMGLSVMVSIVFAAPHLFDFVMERLNDTIFNKTESLSYLERSMWTRTSYEAGWSSYLIGVGLGSTRASNFAAALFGSTGILGIMFYFGFVAQRLMQRVLLPDPVAQAVASALKWSFFPPFAVSLLVGTTPDFGTIEALRWGVLLALVLATRAGAQDIGETHTVRSAPLAATARRRLHNTAG